MPRLLLPALAALLLAPGRAHAQPTDSLAADVEIVRVAADAWRVTYAFHEPVTGVVFGDAVGGYRADAWEILTPGVRRAERDGRDALVADGAAGSTLRLAVRGVTATAANQYDPLLPFSDGGAALYLGVFSGDALVGDEARPLALTIRFAGRPGEQVLVPSGAEHGGDAYVYFGPQEAVPAGAARLVLDPATPPWLRDAFARVTGATTRLFADRLGVELPEAPLVFIGAGELEAADGYSIKGGAVGSQVVMGLTGRGLREESEGLRAAFERLVAHELAHLWQLRTLPSGFSDDAPWVHEGGAEAMAIYTLGETGLWTPGAVDAYAEAAEGRCATALDGGTLREATDRGDWDAVYACGLGLFRASALDPLAAWAALAREVAREGRPYDQATFDRALAGGSE